MQKRTSRESVMNALCLMVLDFQKWMVAETKAMHHWKNQSTPTAIVEGRMIDDVQAQLDSYRKLGEKSATLPRLLLSVQRIKEAPDVSQIIGVPFEINAVIPTDPQRRKVAIRAIPRSYRVQYAFVVNDPDSAQSFTDQFTSYIQLLEKRRIEIEYDLAFDTRDKWHLTIFDNSIFPDSASVEESNITIGLLDFTMSGLLPLVVEGMPTYGQPDDKEVPPAFHVVVEADMYPDTDDPHLRQKADIKTGERSQEWISKGGQP
ncbi:hypothetical protein DJ533_00155 (plasmid) [Acinetobacter defluvii]|uniref:Uncharacterized protein n=1 Tax=Acinetobacter defluvii TaxID=1871111 RepID=A0A2S2F818_9GAMM|nr:hypothetical protein [Acinetobacter defluvii]AWL27131.1 hypothetical protein DJ533_00155 [Acinetobacter defluvii]